MKTVTMIAVFLNNYFIDDFRSNVEIMESLSVTLSKMPDLERMLAQIHSLSKGSRSSDHPDTRYDNEICFWKRFHMFFFLKVYSKVIS